MLANSEADSVRSVKPCLEHPYKMWTIKDGRLRSFVPVKQKPKEVHTLPYQALPLACIQNACIDVIKPSNILDKKSITGTEIIPFAMDEIEFIDINTLLDFLLAQTVLEKDLAWKQKKR